jgi:membrane protease subunit HflC
MSSRNLIVIVVSLAVFLFVSNALYIVRETERAVKLKFGEVVNPDVPPGLHFKWPLVNNIRKFDGRVLTVDAQPERFLTLEKKALIVDSYAKWRVSDVAKYYTSTSGDESRANGLLAQRINDGLRNQMGVRTLQEVVSGERDQLMTQLLVQLNSVARDELGVEVVDVRVKKIDLPPSVSDAVFRRMNAEREKEARELRSQGRELAEGIRAAADREVTVIKAGAYRDAQSLRGKGDAQAAATYAGAYEQDQDFFGFTRSLQAYSESFQSKGDLLLIEPDSEFFQYLKDAQGKK